MKRLQRHSVDSYPHYQAKQAQLTYSFSRTVDSSRLKDFHINTTVSYGGKWTGLIQTTHGLKSTSVPQPECCFLSYRYGYMHLLLKNLVLAVPAAKGTFRTEWNSRGTWHSVSFKRETPAQTSANGESSDGIVLPRPGLPHEASSSALPNAVRTSSPLKSLFELLEFDAVLPPSTTWQPKPASSQPTYSRPSVILTSFSHQRLSRTHLQSLKLAHLLHPPRRPYHRRALPRPFRISVILHRTVQQRAVSRLGG